MITSSNDQISRIKAVSVNCRLSKQSPFPLCFLQLRCEFLMKLENVRNVFDRGTAVGKNNPNCFSLRSETSFYWLLLHAFPRVTSQLHAHKKTHVCRVTRSAVLSIQNHIIFWGVDWKIWFGCCFGELQCENAKTNPNAIWHAMTGFKWIVSNLYFPRWRNIATRFAKSVAPTNFERISIEYSVSSWDPGAHNSDGAFASADIMFHSILSYDIICYLILT